MQIDRLILKNFRGFANFDQPLNSRLTLIVGKNGTGKTSILDALSVAFGSFLLGIPVADARHLHKREAHEFERDFGGKPDFTKAFPIRVEAEGRLPDPLTGDYHKLSWARELGSIRGRTTTKEARDLSSISEKAYQSVVAGDDPDLPLLSYYGANRLWELFYLRKRKHRPSRFDAYRNSHEPSVSSEDLLDWLRRMRLGEFETGESSPSLAAWRGAVEACFEANVKVGYSPSRERLEVEFVDERRTVAYENLSHGQRNILSMVGDIAFKAIILNPHLGAEAVRSARGIILIDEIDLHLHPTWQKKIVPALLEAFPEMQFVVSSHSPFVIQSISEGVMLDLDEMEFDDRVYSMPIVDIITDVQGVEERDRSMGYVNKRESAGAYLSKVARLAECHDPDEREALEEELDAMERGFQDPALEAMMKMERISSVKQGKE
ncbi:AAA family ATPase [Shimia sp. R10_1]|uniref:AAA family ATPase n=1 Tax=Shimia sp. R10_1 TaxID=2821095 RepID=UPI001AD95EB3|nr:AAA family ATPase [Shimia sp. R10_1]MBO9473379.1 AAA family ATPase [Shimia sp. R10_1]